MLRNRAFLRQLGALSELSHACRSSRPCPWGIALGIPKPKVKRLDQLLALNLGVSRRQVARLLSKGAIQDRQGATLSDGRMPIKAPLDVRVHEQLHTLYASMHLLLHKPRGCVTALKDKLHPTAFDYVQHAPLASLLRPIGRLDLDTSGLLLWTTQGPLLHAMTHPKRAVPRCYHVGLHRPYHEPPTPLVLKDGHQPRIERLEALAPEQVHPALDQSLDPACFAHITLLGGAYHEVRRIFAALGSHVISLCRVRHGDWPLPEDLGAGEFQRIELED